MKALSSDLRKEEAPVPEILAKHGLRTMAFDGFAADLVGCGADVGRRLVAQATG